MIVLDGTTLRVTAPMIIANARALLAAGQESLTGGSGVLQVDLSAVAAVDSSALTVIFAWMRRLQPQGRSLSIVAPPASLLSLADLYGISDLLPLA